MATTCAIMPLVIGCSGISAIDAGADGGDDVVLPSSMIGFYLGTLRDQTGVVKANIVFDVLQGGSVLCCLAGADAVTAAYSAISVSGVINQDGKTFLPDLETTYSGETIKLTGTIQTLNGAGVASGPAKGASFTGTWQATLRSFGQ